MPALNYTLPGLLLTGLLFVPISQVVPVSRSDADETLPQPSLSLCKPGLFVKDELYFGLLKAAGGTITEMEWQQFVDRVVTPRFRDGLTVVNVRGQYLSRSGKLVVEPSKLLLLIYEGSKVREQAIAEIVAAYKQTFRQESVLRVTACVQATF